MVMTFRSAVYASWTDPPPTSSRMSCSTLSSETSRTRSVTGALRSMPAASRTFQFTKMFTPPHVAQKIDHVGQRHALEPYLGDGPLQQLPQFRRNRLRRKRRNGRGGDGGAGGARLFGGDLHLRVL